MSFVHGGVPPGENWREGDRFLLTHLGRLGLFPMTTKTASTVPIPMMSRNSIREFSTGPFVFHPLRRGGFSRKVVPRHPCRRAQ